MNINYGFSALHESDKDMYGRKEETVNAEQNPIIGICHYSRAKTV